jgi:lysophospholipase L1-like esterase
MSLALKFALSPLLVGQAVLARVRVPRLPEAEGARAGVAGSSGPALRLLIAGDSSAAGVGVATQDQAFAGRLTHELALHCSAQWHWRLIARSGWTSAQLLRELECCCTEPLDLAVIATGVNDVVEQVPSHKAVAARSGIANLLRNRCGAQHVVFCPLPPIGQFPGLPQPLRWVAGADAKRHNAALTRWAATRGDVSVAVLDDVQLNRGVMAQDGFHPGKPLYRQVASAVGAHIARQVWPGLQLYKQ